MQSVLQALLWWMVYAAPCQTTAIAVLTCGKRMRLQSSSSVYCNGKRVGRNACCVTPEAPEFFLAAPSFDTDFFPELGESTPCTRARTLMLQRTDDGGSPKTRLQTRFQAHRAARTGSCGGARTYSR
uniref:hypothetical protein n=1 Tax=Xanthomonas sp. 0924 TaxID=2835534 RepID=UPI003F7D3823